MKNSTHIRGITLVEVLVSSVLVAILAGAGYSILNLYIIEARDSSAHQRIQTQADVVFEQISRNIRNSSLVLTSGDPIPELFECEPGDELTTISTDMIQIYNNDKLIAGYRINSGVLQELALPEASWVSFETGGNEILLDSLIFSLDGCRKSVQAKFWFRFIDIDTYYSKPRRGHFLCRN
ncbi:hypothetical protein CHISP_2298 [Chitinispirillum alkaliphilum]|nr:hypothetical protein CHISP_2298 [Chitinispirillum alkaliphilum]